MPKRHSAGLRFAARIAFVVFWLTAGGLALEFYESWRQVQRERHAAEYMRGAAEEPPFMRPATVEEQARIVEQGFGPRALAQAKEPSPPPAEAKPPRTEASQERFWTLLGMEEDARNARATLDGEHWMLFDESERLEVEVGDPFFRARESYYNPILELGWFHAFANLQPGESAIVDEVAGPMWRRRVTRLNASDPRTGAAKTLIQSQLLLPHPIINELLELYGDMDSGHVLVPSYINRPGLTGATTTDQFGFVNKPVALPKPDGVFRIVCIGGSTTHEGEVGSMRTTDLLQQRFEAQFDGVSVEVVNCGIAGSNSHDFRRHAMDYLRYEPDLLLYYEGMNDVTMLLGHRYSQIPPMKLRLLKSKFMASRYNRWLLDTDGYFESDWRHTTQRNLLALRLAAEEAGVPMVCASFAWAQRDTGSRAEVNYLEVNARTTWGAGFANYDTLDHYLERHNANLKRICEAHGMGYLPLAENYHHGLTHFRDLCHFTTTGMQERARLLHAWLTPWLEERLVPAG
jgi:lysophospholipase L1-like esterase